MDSMLERLDVAVNPKNSFTYGPIPDERIAAAEAELGLSFPVSYRLFLGQFGAAQIPRLEIYGLPDPHHSDPSKPYFMNVVRHTLYVRKIGENNKIWDKTGADRVAQIYFATDGGGLTFFLDSSIRDDQGESPVFVMSLSVPWQPIAGSFIAFLEKLKNETEPYANLRSMK